MSYPLYFTSEQFKAWLEEGSTRTIALFRAVQVGEEFALQAEIRNLAEESMLAAGAEAMVMYVPPVAAFLYMIKGVIDDFEAVRTLLRNQETANGFSQGTIMGLLGWRWRQVVDHFGKHYMNLYIQPDLNRIEVSAYNFGLRVGYYFAAQLSIPVRQAYLRDCRKDSGASKGRWTRADRISYVIELAASFRKRHMSGLNVSS